MSKHGLWKRLREIAEAEGAKLLDIEWGGKHPRMVCAYQGRTIRTVVAGSPSDHRALMNIRTQLRRVLRSSAEPIATEKLTSANGPK